MLRVLLIGCGDVALRTAALLRGRVRLLGLIRKPQDAGKLRAHRIVPIVGDLDDFRTLERLCAAPFAVLHFAPPPGEGRDDPRTQKLLAALARSGRIPQRFVYIFDLGGVRRLRRRANLRNALAPPADAAREASRRRRGPHFATGLRSNA